MVRSHCMGPVVVLLALTGLAHGQAKPVLVQAAEPGQARQHIITVQENDQQGQRCRVLKSWFLPDGSRAFQVQALDGGEMLTVVETGPTTPAAPKDGRPFKAVATRIYHWAGRTTPPDGAPVPPSQAPVVALQPTAPPVLAPNRTQLVSPTATSQHHWYDLGRNTPCCQNQSVIVVQGAPAGTTQTITPVPQSTASNRQPGPAQTTTVVQTPTPSATAVPAVPQSSYAPTKVNSVAITAAPALAPPGQTRSNADLSAHAGVPANTPYTTPVPAVTPQVVRIPDKTVATATLAAKTPTSPPAPPPVPEKPKRGGLLTRWFGLGGDSAKANPTTAPTTTTTVVKITPGPTKVQTLPAKPRTPSIEEQLAGVPAKRPPAPTPPHQVPAPTQTAQLPASPGLPTTLPPVTTGPTDPNRKTVTGTVVPSPADAATVSATTTTASGTQLKVEARTQPSATSQAKVETVPAKPSDWHLSWGKATSAKKDTPANGVRTGAEPADAPKKETAHAPVTSPDLPMASKRTDDPLNDLANYTRLPEFEGKTSKGGIQTAAATTQSKPDQPGGAEAKTVQTAAVKAVAPAAPPTGAVTETAAVKPVAPPAPAATTPLLSPERPVPTPLPANPITSAAVAVSPGSPPPAVQPGLPAQLPPPPASVPARTSFEDKNLSAPPGRRSVLAAQAAAAENDQAPRPGSSTSLRAGMPVVQSDPREGNAFTDPPAPRQTGEVQANAFAAGEQVAQGPTPGAGQPGPEKIPVFPRGPGEATPPTPGQPEQIPVYPRGPYPGQPGSGTPNQGPPYQGQPYGPGTPNQVPPYPGQPYGPGPGGVPQPGMNPYARPPLPGMPMQPGMIPPPPGLPMMRPMMPPPPPLPGQCPVPSGYANAFTQAGNARPIPADMGNDPSNTDNAFQSIAGATLAVPPGPCGPVCPPGGCGMNQTCPSGPQVAMAPGGSYGLPPGQPGMAQQPDAYAMGPGAPTQPVPPNPALAPVRGAEQALAQAPQAVQPAQQPAGNAVVTAGAKVAVANTASSLPEAANLPELLSLLSDSLYPSQREWAADRLARFDWRVQPQIVESLLLAAKDDPAPLVRVASIRALVQLKAGTTYVVAALHEMKKDKDDRVRQEAELALSAFVPGGARATDRSANKPAK